MKDTPLYQIFDLIAQSGVGNLGSTGLIMLQLYLSLFLEIRFLFSAMKKKPLLVQISISMIPMVLIATYSIGCGIIFSAFLGNGPDINEMAELIGITLTDRSIKQMLIAAAVFFVLMLIYSKVYKLKAIEWLMTFGIETFAALSLLTLYGGLLVKDFPYTVLDLSRRDIYLVRWPVYGYFTVLFKCFVLIMSLLLGFALRERKDRSLNEEEKYTDRHKYNEKKVLKYLTKNDTVTGIGLLLFCAASLAFFTYMFLSDTSTDWNFQALFPLLLIGSLFVMLGAFGAVSLYRGLRPQTSMAYRQLLAMGDKNTVLELFCEEIVDGGPPQANLWTGKAEIRTTHFLLHQQGIRTWVEWIYPVKASPSI